MARTSNKLTATTVDRCKDRGRYGDGNGLWLNVTNTGRKAWVYRWMTKNQPVREMGLGSYPSVSLQAAREAAAECRRNVAAGKDPKQERNRLEEGKKTFGEATKEFLEDKSSQWSNTKHRQQWRNTLRDYCGPINSLHVDDIELNDVLKVLRPIWQEKPETASRVRGRIEQIISYSMTRGWRSSANPAIWRGNLSNVLPKPKKLVRGHHASMSWQEVPQFFEQLQNHSALAARALELLILTATRSGEILNASWEEFDLENAIWTIPAGRMKMRKEHRVPLSNAALAVLGPLKSVSNDQWVFPGQASGKPLSGMAMEMLLRRMNIKSVTVHGFRSSFRDWCAEETSFAWEIAELSLAHKIGTNVEAAYRRTDLLEKRRLLMDAWANCCIASDEQKVVALHG